MHFADSGSLINAAAPSHHRPVHRLIEIADRPSDLSTYFTGGAGFPDQRDAATIPGIAHRDHGGTAGPDQRSDHGTLRRLFREELLRPVRALREEMLPRVQGRAHGYPETRNYAHQFSGNDANRLYAKLAVIG